ncbi:MAG: sulfatase-like hydrolase/transferase, partial [Kofleriaceae bacterium]
ATWGAGLAAGAGLVLAAALVVAIADLVHAGGGGLALIGVWALIALPLALLVGCVLGAGNATWGPGWVRGMVRRLREDPALDRAVAGILIAAVLVGGVMAFGVSQLAIKLVANVNRKEVGALLLGGVVVGLVPLFAILVLPVYRVTRWFAHAVPAIGPLSRVVVLIVSAIIAGVGLGLFIVFKRLDYQVLNLGQYIAPAMVLVIAGVLGLLLYGPLAGLRQRIPARGIVAGGAAVVALAVAVIGMGAPSDGARLAVTERSYVGPLVIPALRGLFDRDGDGFSAFFGGDDCDDTRADVNPKAREIAADGIDNNCVGGDSKVEQDNPIPDAGPPAAPTISGGKNVLVIFVDTLRADRMGYAGYQRDGKSLTPRLDALAKDAVVFTHAYAQAPNTPRSVPSFLASRYPSELAVDRDTRDYPMVKDAGNDLLFETLKGGGFKTIGMTSHFYFCAPLPPKEGRRDPSICPGVAPYLNSNVLQGADEWDNSEAVDIPPSNHDYAGPRIVKKSIAKLEQLAKADGKFAMLVHLFEPHSTYMEHPGFPITERGTASLMQKYDYEIAVTDRYIGELLDALDKTGLASTTTVVVMSDHGEAFGVHNFAGQSMFFHGQTLYRELIHVPLIFRIPNVTGRVANDVVQLIDLAPTIAALFGVKPPASWQGRSLVPAIEGKPLPPKPAFAELLPADAWKHNARSMITADGKRHVFYVISDKRWEIFDLEADPLEKKNVFDSEPTKQALQDQLGAWLDRPRTETP